ncbi:MAG: phytanoyl-CoA dioxygenase family protein, partial [Lentisphaeria bacterium]|nr:phytanoyl-CoA dioxygenase family protein [Lentisphaeria bacterium]
MLTQKQIDEFHRDGFLRIPQVFQGEELALLRAAADDVTAAGIAGQGDDHLYENIDGRETYYRSEMMWNRSDIFRAVTVKPQLLAAIGQCYGEAFLPLNDSYVCKTPRSMVPILWHQDPPYTDAEAHPLTQST